MSNSAQRYSGHGDRGVKGSGKRGTRNTNNRENKKNHVGGSEPKQKWEEDRQQRKFVFHPKSDAQRASLWSFEENMVTVNYGSVASGKTAISCWWLANQYLEGNIDKIYIGRPNTTLDNRQNGFRTGSLLDKCYGSVLPQIKYLSDVLGRSVVDMQLEKKDGFIELLDIEFLRGMDFGYNIGIHLDEAQLLSPAEIDCMMTRLSTGSKLILSCDPLQRDQPKEECGVIYLKKLVEDYNLQDINIVQYTRKDITRSDFVYDYVCAMQDNYGMEVN